MKVLVLPGDGIGPEVMTAATTVAGALGLKWDFDVRDDVCSDRWLQTGEVLPDDLMGDLQSGAYDGILFGAVGDPRAPEGVVERALLLRLRFELDLALNVRPLRLPAGVASPLTSQARIDAVVVRENTEGAYSGIGGRMRRGQPAELATTVSVTTRVAAERAVAHAVEVARARRRQVTLVHKANVLSFEGGLWRELATELAAANPDVAFAYEHADLTAMRLFERPESYDVIVTDNLFGDLLTDLGAALAGGIGLAPSANFNPATSLALFEPVHGTAPDIAGQGKANPLAMIRCLGLAAQHFGEAAPAQRIEQAVDQVARSDDTRPTAVVVDDFLRALDGSAV